MIDGDPDPCRRRDRHLDLCARDHRRATRTGSWSRPNRSNKGQGGRVATAMSEATETPALDAHRLRPRSPAGADDDHAAALGAFRRGAAVLAEHPTETARPRRRRRARLPRLCARPPASPATSRPARRATSSRLEFAPLEVVPASGSGLLHRLLRADRRRLARADGPVQRAALRASPTTSSRSIPTGPPPGIDPSYRFARTTTGGLAALSRPRRDRGRASLAAAAWSWSISPIRSTPSSSTSRAPRASACRRRHACGSPMPPRAATPTRRSAGVLVEQGRAAAGRSDDGRRSAPGSPRTRPRRPR